MTLTRIALAAVLCGICTPLALAKRIAPKEVTPLVRDGIEYSAPLGASKIGIVRARDVATKKTLWEQKIYTIEYDPDLERDVQWVFISDLEIEDGSLIVTNERGRRFSLDLETRKVRSLGAGNAGAQPEEGLRLVLELDSTKVREGQGFQATLHLVNAGPKPVDVFTYADLGVNLVHEDGTAVPKTTNMGSGALNLESLKKRLVTCPKQGSIQLARFDPHVDKPGNKLVYTAGRGRVGWQLAPGRYRISVTLKEDGALPERLGMKDAWTGTLTSNEVAFMVF